VTDALTLEGLKINLSGSAIVPEARMRSTGESVGIIGRKTGDVWKARLRVASGYVSLYWAKAKWYASLIVEWTTSKTMRHWQ